MGCEFELSESGDFKKCAVCGAEVANLTEQERIADLCQSVAREWLDKQDCREAKYIKALIESYEQ